MSLTGGDAAYIMGILITNEGHMQSHPAAEIFPLLTGAKLDELIYDIKMFGQLEPIIVHDGMILDGRNRYAACLELGIEPITKEWVAGGTPEAFVLSMNLHRRHLTESQKSLIAAGFADAPRGGDRQTAHAQFAPTVTEAARMMDVGERTVYEAKTVLKDGTPEEIAAVEGGEVAVSTVADKIRAHAKSPCKPKPVRLAGPQIKVPAGKTLEDLGREGGELESTGATVAEAANALGLGQVNYSMLRNTVELADLDFLTESDRQIVADTLAAMNSATHITNYYEAVKPIADRVWGTKNRGTARAIRMQQRYDAFDRAINTVITAGPLLDQIDVPYLSKKQTKGIVADLNKAEQGIKVLRFRIKELCT